MYLIIGEDEYFIKTEIDNLIKEVKQKNKTSEIEIHRFFGQVNLEEVSDALYNIDIFCMPKIVIFENLELFNSKIKSNSKSSQNDFFDLVFSADSAVNIVLSQVTKKYDKNFLPSPLFKRIENVAKLIQTQSISEKKLYSFVKNFITTRGGEIDEFALLHFLAIMPNDLTFITNEICKLLLQNKHITLQMIEDNNFAMSNNIEFAFSDAILKNVPTETIIYKLNEQLNFGVSANQLLSQIASLLSYAKEIYLLRVANFSTEQIAANLNIHSFRVKLFIDFFNKVGNKKITALIDELAKIDLDIKNGFLDENLALQSFVLKLIK
ncbi:DNA polymerase III subunit delta [Metamycoplasma equirhinis]|uniref:DNA polymerase III subunit delta n=1 Tax=Metamycoplasma equirhinis TaxID=92402 RepID=UPI0035937601